jgi:hypothetical protein
MNLNHNPTNEPLVPHGQQMVENRCLQSLQKAWPQSIRVALFCGASSRHAPQLMKEVSQAVGWLQRSSGGCRPASKNILFVPSSASFPNKLSTFHRWCMSRVLACRGRIAKKSTTFCKSSLCPPVQEEESYVSEKHSKRQCTYCLWSSR